MRHTQKNDHFDVIVIGGGPIGLSAAYHINKEDNTKTVAVLEQFSFINDEVSSSGKSRQFRVQYDTVPMAQLALRAEKQWKALNAVSGTKLLDQVGALWFGDPEATSSEGGIEKAIEVMDELGILYEVLEDGTAIMERFNFSNIQDDYSGFFQKDGGILNIEATQQFLLDQLSVQDQVQLYDFVEVYDIVSLEGGEIQVYIQNSKTKEALGYYTTEKLAIIPGPYVNDLVANFGIKVGIDIWEMSSAYYKITDPELAEKSTTWYVFQEDANTSVFYGFNEVDWSHPGYVRVAPAIPDRIIDHPSERTGIPSDISLGYNTDWVKAHMPGLEQKVSYPSTCLVALSKTSQELLLDYLPATVPNHKNIVVYTAGWAGKFIPTIGDLVAKMVTERLTEEDQYFLDQLTIDWIYDFDKYALRLHAPKHLLTKSREKSEKPVMLPKGHKGFISKPEDGLEIDVAIIGAGASGLYSGYRLKTGVDTEGRPLHKNVQIFEASDRICGRLDSIQLPGMNVTGELGGMRYMEHQEIINGLINQYESQGLLTSIDFNPSKEEEQLYYLRKQRFQAKDITSDFRTRYYVDAQFEGKSANTIFNQVIDEVLQADGTSIEEIQNSPDPQETWRTVKRTLRYNFPGPYEGKYVYEIGFWNLLKDRSSQECYEFLANGGGYYSNTINWNAAEAFPYMVGDFADDDVSYKTIEGGFDKVLKVTAHKFISSGGTIRPNNALVSFEKVTDGASTKKYKLIFQHIETGVRHNFQVKDTSKQWVVYADEIILGMPRRSLELLDQSNFLFNPFNEVSKPLYDNIKTVMGEPSLKILLGFTYPWWPDQSPHSITDLPMRQCYYFGTDPENHHSLFLASYNDMRTVSFWKSMENDAPFETVPTPLLQSKPWFRKQLKDFLNKDIPPATKSMVAEVMKQAREMHGDNIDIPEPYTSAYKDWSEDPYGGGYHAWKAGFVVADKMPEIRQPQANEAVYIVGEAYSDQQGWVEGAFCEAEKVMLHRYNLQRLPWVQSNYYLEWGEQYEKHLEDVVI